MKQLILSLSFLAGSISLFAQSTETDATLTARAQAFADEVFLDCNQYAGPDYIEGYANALSRVEIKTEAISAAETYIPLSTVALKNKCNNSLERDTELTFNPENFNPFKYHLNLYKSTDVTYRVDNTVYIIVIHHN